MEVESTNTVDCPECGQSMGAQDMSDMGNFSPCNPNDSDKYKAQCSGCKHKFTVIVEFHCVASVTLAK